MTCCGVVSLGVLHTQSPSVLDAGAITELVRNAGGNVNALFRASLAWNSWSDIDFHLDEPEGGEHIFYSHKRSGRTDGTLDVDMNISSGAHDSNTNKHSKPAVENIMYTDLGKMMDGVYRLSYVQYGVYASRTPGDDAPFLLLENRTADEPRMSHYVLLKYNGANAEKDTSRKIPLANVRKEGTNFILDWLAPDVSILQNHNFNLGSYGVNGTSTNTATEHAATTGSNPTGV